LGLEHGANFSVPGAGKTAVTYALYELERLRGRVARLLVVSPLSAFDAWGVEAERSFSAIPTIWRFNGRIPVGTEVVLVNYQKLAPYSDNLAAWLLEAPTHLVLDEAHRAKAGRDGEWGSACLDLSHLAVRRDILTGTPAPQGPTDLIALVDFLWPQQARRILPADALMSQPTDAAMRRVSRVLAPFFVRTTKRELGLDPPRRWVEVVELQGLQAEIYSALRNRYAGMLDLSRPDRTMLAQMGEVMVYLLQAATNPALLARRLINQGPAEFRFPSLEIPQGSRLADLIAQYPSHEIPPKFRKLAVITERNATEHRKTLVWSNFPDNLLALERLLARYQPALIYGAIPSDDGTVPPGTRTREAELERFRSDPNCLVLLANPAATAEGVSLHEVCHDAVYLDRTFNAGQFLQSVDRIHRLGLPPGTETRITFLLTRGTIDEAVDTRVAIKAERLAQMLNDPDLVAMALPDDEDYGQAIEDVADIAALFEHLRGG
jgi:SNF2 family DNA or RNA helicase